MCCSDQDIELIDRDDTNTSVVSFSPATVFMLLFLSLFQCLCLSSACIPPSSCSSPALKTKQEDSKLLATYRCPDSTSRLEMRVRTVEGSAAKLQVFIIPRLNPKTAQVVVFPIKPLSLHTRVHDLSIDRPVNTLSISGGFSLNEMHAWLSKCIPEMPEVSVPSLSRGLLSTRIRSSYLADASLCDSYRLLEDNAEFMFVSTFVGTILVCQYRYERSSCSISLCLSLLLSLSLSLSVCAFVCYFV